MGFEPQHSALQASDSKVQEKWETLNGAVFACVSVCSIQKHEEREVRRVNALKEALLNFTK